MPRPRLLPVKVLTLPFSSPVMIKEAMRILGNSLSTFQAAFVLGLSLQNFPELQLEVDAMQCVDWCQSACPRYPTTLVESGWMMRSLFKVGQLMAREVLHDEILHHLLPSEHCFRTLSIVAGAGDEAARFPLKVSQHITNEAALQRLQLLPELVVPAQDEQPPRFDCPQSVSAFSLAEVACRPGHRQQLIVWANDACYVACRNRQFFHQLRQIFEEARQGASGKIACFDAAGMRYYDIDIRPCRCPVLDAG